MKHFKNYFALILMSFTILSSSCSNKSAKADEPEIETMDSVSTALDKTNQELEEQTKKVEASLEKIDKEFETTK